MAGFLCPLAIVIRFTIHAEWIESGRTFRPPVTLEHFVADTELLGVPVRRHGVGVCSTARYQGQRAPRFAVDAGYVVSPKFQW